MEEIHKKVPCRERQMNDLLDLLGEDDDPLPVSIFISGNMATGKSLCINTVLQYLRFKHVFIDCIECYEPKTMYEAIVTGLYGDQVDVKCDSLPELINNLNVYSSQQSRYEPIVLVFDRAEKFQLMDSRIMSTFLRLREFCSLNICTFFVTHLIYENFDFKMGVRDPIKIYFPNYDKEELYRIISMHREGFVRHILNNHTDNIDGTIIEDLEKPELFANFLNAFLSVFYRSCRNLIELQHMARVNFVKYCEPILKNEIKSTDLTNLWRHIAPILKKSLELLYLRISSPKLVAQSAGEEKEDWVGSQNHNIENTLKEELLSTKTFVQSFQIPYYGKFLLISAYLASYNPPKQDKRLFMVNHGKQRKTLQQIKAKAKVNEKLNTQIGPKVFTLDRLQAIFYAILGEKLDLNSKLLSQITTLVEYKLIECSKENLDAPKYKCLVGYDFIVAVSQTVSFNIRKYLYDFI